MIQELQSARIDLYIDQGDTYYKPFTIKDDSGAVLDLSGYTVEAVMKRYFNTKTDYNLVASVVDAPTGKIALSMTEMASRALLNDRYVYSVKLRNSTVAVKIIEGQVLVTNTTIAPVTLNLGITGNQSVGTGA